jgi:hypothetical protein
MTMKPGKKLSIAFICITTLFGSAMGCKKDSPLISIKGFYLTDVAGNNIGLYGQVGDDWILQVVDLSEREMALLDFPVSADLDNTAEGSIAASMLAYPNPVSNVQSFSIQMSDSALLKMAFVNDNLEVLQTAFGKVKNSAIHVDLSNRSKFPLRSSVRVYYSLSAQGKPNFRTGYGDIRICDSQPVLDCF